VLVDAEARANLLAEVEIPDVDPRPDNNEVSVTAPGYSEYPCWKGLLLANTSSVWLHDSEGTKTLSDRRTFLA